MYFIELLNFSNASPAENDILHGQLKSTSQKKVRWVEWTSAMNTLVAVPDVTLICAINENWHSLKKIIDKSSAKSIVLYGCTKSILALPTLKNIYDIDEMLEFIDVKSNIPTFITTQPLPSPEGQERTWKATIPMQIGH